MTSLKKIYRNNLILTVFLPFFILILIVSAVSYYFFRDQKLSDNKTSNQVVTSSIKTKIDEIQNQVLTSVNHIKTINSLVKIKNELEHFVRNNFFISAMPVV